MCKSTTSPPEDFWGKEGCNELLVLSRPDVIRAIHASFLEAGCDVIETDSFGSAKHRAGRVRTCRTARAN